LKDLSSDEESELEDILMKPMLIITSLDSMDTSSKEYQEKFGQLPPNMSVYDVISFMDESQKFKNCLKILIQEWIQWVKVL